MVRKEARNTKAAKQQAAGATKQASATASTSQQDAQATAQATSAKTGRAQPDVIALLKADHRAVEKMFAEYDAATSGEDKTRLTQQICRSLAIHARAGGGPVRRRIGFDGRA